MNKLADRLDRGPSSRLTAQAVPHASPLLAACVLSLVPLVGLPALDVAKSEIESTRDAKVSFVNYEGPQSVVESAQAIRDIGSSLALAIGKPGGTVTRAGETDRYAVVRAVDPATTVGLDADIIIIGKDAIVDHIDNVRRIVAGYLEGAWAYSRADATTLAVFITVYNAVHRGDLAYFGSKYKAVVTKELSAEDAGLATKWDQWPGRTRIVIPLSSGALPGAAGAVSTGTISGKEVTQGMKSEPGAGIPDRQALVDIKQKEASQAQDQAAKAKDAAAAAAAQAAAAQAQLAQAQKDLAAAQKAAPPAAPAAQPASGGTAAASPTAPTAQPPVAQAPAAQAPAAQAPPAQTPTAQAPAAQGQAQQATATTPQVAAAQTKVAEAQKAADAAQADAAAKAAAAQQADANAAAKQAAVAADRQAISADQNAAIADQVAKAKAAGTLGPGGAGGLLLLEIVDAGYPFARVDLVNAQTGALIAASTLNSIRSRSLVDGGSIIVAVAGKEGGTGAVRLVAIDKGSLAQTAQGEVDIFPESVVAKIGDSYFAVIKSGDGKYYLGRFGADLKESARSKEEVNPYTFVVQGPPPSATGSVGAAGATGAAAPTAAVVAQAAAGGFLSLDATSLATTGKLGL